MATSAEQSSKLEALAFTGKGDVFKWVIKSQVGLKPNKQTDQEVKFLQNKSDLVILMYMYLYNFFHNIGLISSKN